MSESKPLLIETEDRISGIENGTVRSFGEYELLEEIARGGMGVVYRARQTALGRIVALKMILAGHFASKQIIQRFHGEVTAAALLQHPNIVAVHDVGIHDDQHYFSMDYVEGQNLAQFVGNQPLPSAKAARYIRIIAEAIHYAHGQGVLHRDLKPSNILIDSSTDQPRITDFGLAKRLDGESSLTVTGQMLGSPNFMPPEQAGSEHRKVGRHSDVYGLGAILYFLLTARAPFQADSLADIVTQVLQSEPLAPRTLNPSVPRDLETICLKCLVKEPHGRYATAGELAGELSRFLKDEPIQARPTTQFGKSWRWCRRNPIVASLMVALLLAITIGFAGVAWQLHRVRQEESMGRQNLYAADMNRAYQAWSDGSLQRAQDLLLAHLPRNGKEDLRGFEWRYLWNLCQDESRLTFTNIQFAGESHGLTLAADGKKVIAASRDSFKWLDVEAGKEVQTLITGTNPIIALAEASERPGLIAYNTDRIKVLSPSGEALLEGGIFPKTIYSSHVVTALSPDGKTLAYADPSINTMVALFETSSGAKIGQEFDLGLDEDVLSMAFSPDGKYLVCGTLGTKLHVLEVPTLNQDKVVTGYSSGFNRLFFDHAGKKFASGSGDSHIRVWSFPECELIAEPECSQGGIGDLVFSPDGLRLASGGPDHTIRIWDLAHPGKSAYLHGHRGSVISLLFSRDGMELYSGSDDRTVKVWDLSLRESTTMLHQPDWADQVCFSADGKLLAVSDFNGHSATLWQLSTRTIIGTLGHHSGKCRRASFSPDGTLLATAGSEQTVQISRVASGKTAWIFPVPTNGPIANIAFHPSRPILALASLDLCFWNLLDGQRMNLPVRNVGKIESTAFSADGKWIACGMKNGEVTVLDFETGKQLHSFRVHSKGVGGVTFSHSGNLLASQGWDSLIVIYDLRRHTQARLQGHFSQIRGLAFAPDEKTLVSTGYDGTIRFWAVANHETALSLTHDGGAVLSVAFSPDGNLMATSGADGTARLWPAERSDNPRLLKLEKGFEK